MLGCLVGCFVRPFHSATFPFISGMHFYHFILFYIILHHCHGQQISLVNNNSSTSSVKTVNEGGDGEEMNEVHLDAEWACGTDDFSRFLAESTIDRDCPERKNVINNCCVLHDNCYDEQLGQQHCDDTFCTCLEQAAQGSEICAKEDSPYFCQLVRQFGQQYYNASAKLDGKSPIVPINSERKPNRAQRPSTYRS